LHIKCIGLNSYLWSAKNEAPAQRKNCLIGYYKDRIEFLENYSKPIAGFYKYPSLGITPDISIDFLDSKSGAAKRINKIVTNAGDIYEKDSGTSAEITIRNLTKSIVVIEINSRNYIGVHPSFDQKFYYVDLKTLKQLNYKDLFQERKIQELSKAIFDQIKPAKDESIIPCYAEINNEEKVKPSITNLDRIQIGLNAITIQLNICGACSAYEMFEIDINTIKPYLTGYYKELLAN
jgi:hypothetical protein